MAEHSLIGYVLEGMKPYWEKGIKHADAFTPGIADLSGWLSPAGNVWIELKALREWPKRERTKVVFDFDDLQKDFILQRRGWVLCRVGREYLLFDHYNAQHLELEHTTRNEIYRLTHHRWLGKINWQEFAECVRRHYG